MPWGFPHTLTISGRPVPPIGIQLISAQIRRIRRAPRSSVTCRDMLAVAVRPRRTPGRWEVGTSPHHGGRCGRTSPAARPHLSRSRYPLSADGQPTAWVHHSHQSGSGLGCGSLGHTALTAWTGPRGGGHHGMGCGRDQALTCQPQTPPAHIRLAAPVGQRGTGDLRQYAKNGQNQSSNTLSNRPRLSRYDRTIRAFLAAPEG